MSSDEGDRKAAAKSHDFPRSKTEQLTVSRQETARQTAHETVSTTRLVALGEGTSKRRPGGTLVSFLSEGPTSVLCWFVVRLHRFDFDWSWLCT